MTDAENLRSALVDELTASGWLTTDEWTAAFSAVPRHVFLPRFFALTADGASYEAIDDSHPDWLTMVYRNAVWPTQLDGDKTRWHRARDNGPISGEPTCSSTQPSLMASMLEALHVHDGHRVLEIGTGTGYNAALLAHRLGNDHVVSVDVDTDLIVQARANLGDAGYRPTVTIGDGAQGHRDGAPYDRLIATCSVAAVPPAWLAQVRPGGVILTNLYRQLVGCSLARLTVRDDGTAVGRLLDDSGGFMPLRAHQPANLWGLVKAASKQEGIRRPSRLPETVSNDGPAWTVLADLVLNDVARTDITHDDGRVQWLVHPSGSWAYYETATNDVEQGGPRKLWDELEDIYRLWADNGSPTRDNIGITATPTSETHIWLCEDTNYLNL